MLNRENISLIISEPGNAEIFASQEKRVSNFVHPQGKQEHISIINDRTYAHLSIVELASGKVIGHIILNRVNGNEIELRRIVIYEQSIIYGSMSIILLFEYLKKNYPKSKTIWLDVYHYNEKAINFYESIRFKFFKREGDLLYYRFNLNNHCHL